MNLRLETEVIRQHPGLYRQYSSLLEEKNVYLQLSDVLQFFFCCCCSQTADLLSLKFPLIISLCKDTTAPPTFTM